ncbi:HPr kinase/phosphorylase [Devosia sp. ZW T5_3]|uniref:HPr kinase/phosphorylase n=1 Tax=Devosia sp. ZW T5_3 TaxID=3378085 RepID=UPI0038545170
MRQNLNIHGTAIVLGGAGLLLRGPSGSGKSLLALSLLDRWAARGLDAVLVSDDRVDLSAGPEGLTMGAPAPIAGLIELRGRGILSRPHRSPVPLHLLIDLVPELVRMPESHAFTAELLGHSVPRAPVPQAGLIGLEHQMLLVSEALAALDPPAGRS